MVIGHPNQRVINYIYKVYTSLATINPRLSVLSGSPKSTGGIRLDVQGLRAVAVLAVILYHVNGAWLKAGFIGVDVFFVISGFIITTLLTEPGRQVDLLAFYVGRVKRIVPAYAVMFTTVCVVSAILFLPPDFSFFYRSLKSAALFFSNHYFAEFGSYFAPKAEELPLLHTWSLAIEMQFYIFFPLLILFLPRPWHLPVLSVIALVLFVGSGIQVLSGHQDKLYFSLVARVPEFMVGAIVAIGARHTAISSPLSALLGVLGAALLIGGFLFIDKGSFPGFLSIVPCVGTAAIIIARRGPITDLLSTRALVWLGGISYSLYLWHWPVLAFIRYYTGHYELGSGWVVLALVASLALAWMSYNFVEVPGRRKSNIGKPFAKWAAAAGGMLILILLARHGNRLLDSPLPVEQKRYADAELICHGQQVGDCKRGAEKVQPSILVIGDSHAAQLNYFFDQAGTELGIAYRVLTASSCVPIPGFDIERLPEWAREPCKAQIAAVEEALPHTDKLIIAALWQYQMQSAPFVTALKSFLDDLERSGKQVIVMGQVPMFSSNVQRVRRFQEIGLPASLVLGDDWRIANRQVEAVAASYKSVHYVDFSSSAFFADAPYDQGDLIYLDNQHLNEVGSRRYGHFAGAKLQSLFESTQSEVSLKQ